MKIKYYRNRNKDLKSIEMKTIKFLKLINDDNRMQAVHCKKTFSRRTSKEILDQNDEINKQKLFQKY